jgi:hypothetical protein
MVGVLTRVAASVAVSTAVVAGGLALGTGTASANEAAGSSDSAVGSVVGFVPETIASVINVALFAGMQTGSLEDGLIYQGCTMSCPNPQPTSLQILLGALGIHGENSPWPALPWAPEPGPWTMN